MKKVFLLFALILLMFNNQLKAQVIDDVAGKTYYYYDSVTQKKVKEIYHHKQIMKVMPDKKHYGSYIDTIMYMKNGPYSSYFEDGNLKCTGYYTNERKDSIWKYYDTKGKLIKTELYRQGQIVK
jgi:antitoxin component YwqK of YwqJK toxin-antitoxin module